MKLNLNEYVMEHDKKIKVRGSFINRELSTLLFDERVLYYALRKDIPLNERMKFLAITGSNLDEFISVRFAYVFSNQDKEPYKEILKKIKGFIKFEDNAFSFLSKEIEKRRNLKFRKVNELSKKEKVKLKEEYMNNIFPLLTPEVIGVTTDVPFVYSSQVYVVATILNGGIENVVMINIPKSVDLVYQIGNSIVMTEDIISTFMDDSLFINKDIVSRGAFKIVKDASVILSHDSSKFIVDRMSETLRKRDNSNPLFLEISESSSDRFENILMNIFKVPSGHVCKKCKNLSYKRFMQPILGEDDSYKDFKPFVYENHENYYSLFEALKEDDIFLHHPYDSYETVVKFIQHASEDKDVVAIKQTLYRVSGIDSPIVEALCNAARSGKKVSVLIEIKARFDEENNIKLVRKLKNAGATIILGMEYLKTHCKMCIVVRKENNQLKVYSHVGTGNYNEKTAQLYTDISYLTSRQKVGMDLLHVFNILSGYSSPDDAMQKIFYAPVTLRKHLIKCIDREIENVKKGNKGEIFMKINSFSDSIMVDKIYEAADKGVDVYIICRGVCSIVPRKHLYVKSIVGRFLEHSRIYYFKNSKSPEYYISSADLLTRNLDRRVETLISLKDSNVVKQIKWIIQVYKQDQKNSFEMDNKGHFKHMKGTFDSQKWFIEYSDIKKDKKKWKD